MEGLHSLIWNKFYACVNAIFDNNNYLLRAVISLEYIMVILNIKDLGPVKG